jgi:WD40 repeat protein
MRKFFLKLIFCSSQVKIWNVETRQCVRTAKSGYGLSVLFVPGNKQVVVGTKSGALELYDVSSGNLLERVDAHRGLSQKAQPSTLLGFSSTIATSVVCSLPPLA